MHVSDNVRMFVGVCACVRGTEVQGESILVFAVSVLCSSGIWPPMRELISVRMYRGYIQYLHC